MEKNLKKKTMAGFGYKMLQRIGAQGVHFIVSVVLARLLLPEEYGMIALVSVIITILDVFVTYGFGNSLIADKNSDDLDFSTCFYFGIGLSMLVYLLMYITAPWIAVFYESEALTPVIRVMSLRIPIAAINSVQHAYVAKKMDFKKFFIATSIGTVLSGVIAIIMAYHQFGVWALVEQYLGNILCDTFFLWLMVKWRPHLCFSWERLKKLYSYGWKILVVGLIDTGYNQLRSLIIAKRYTKSDLAYYNKGNQFPQLAMSVVEPTVNGVLFPALAQCKDQDEMRSITRRIIKLGTYLVFPTMIGLIVVSEPLISVVLTDKWLPCVIYLQLGCMAYMLRPLQFINNCVIKASGRSGLLLKLDILKKGIGILLLIFSIRFGVVGIAASSVIISVFSTFVNITPNRKILNYGYSSQFRDIAENALIALVMAAVIWPIRFVPASALVLLILQVTAGVSVYVLLSVLTKNESFHYCLKLLTGFLKKGKKNAKQAG